MFKIILKYNRILLIALLSIVFFNSTTFGAVDPPVLRSSAVFLNGNTTLFWSLPQDPLNEFVRFNVYVSANINGPYTVTPLNSFVASYTDIVNDANITSYYYFIETIYDEGAGEIASIPSDTIRTILPIFTSQTDSTATIEWDPQFVPNISSNSGVYYILRTIGGGPTIQVGSTNYGNEIFTDSFKVCSENISYQIVSPDDSVMNTSSALVSDLFEDKTPPATPVLDSVTVVDNAGVQQVQMDWSASSSPDTRGYTVLYWNKIPPQYVVRDTVYGTSYTETQGLVNPNVDWEEFTVNAFDSCFNPSANTSPAADEQRTIHLTFSPNNCENTVTLNWTPYINWPDLEFYEIWVSVDGNPFLMAKSLPSTDTSFTYQRHDKYAVYCYIVKAVTSGKTKTSSSNRVCVLANSIPLPAQQYFKQVTVSNNKDVHIASLTDSTLPASNYVLYRSLERFDNYYEVQRVPFNNSSVIEMDDFNASVDQTSYFYRIGVEDTCGSIMFISKSAASIFLQGTITDDSSRVDLSWNEYQGWDTVASGVEEYVINYIIDGVSNEIARVPKGVTNFSYYMAEDLRMGANFCFDVMALEADGNLFGQKDSVLSNQVCFTDNLKIFVPNAFRPRGENSTFRPVFSYGNLHSYKMIIYDRWGGQVYETQDIDQGWDGTINGSTASFGAYVYSIEVSNFTGATLKKQGTFVLLR